MADTTVVFLFGFADREGNRDASYAKSIVEEASRNIALAFGTLSVPYVSQLAQAACSIGRKNRVRKG